MTIYTEIVDLAEFLLLGGGLPAKASLDALHIVCAAYHDDLLAYSKAAEARCRVLGLTMVEVQHHAAQVAGLEIAHPA